MGTVGNGRGHAVEGAWLRQCMQLLTCVLSKAAGSGRERQRDTSWRLVSPCLQRLHCLLCLILLQGCSDPDPSSVPHGIL